LAPVSSYRDPVTERLSGQSSAYKSAICRSGTTDVAVCLALDLILKDAVGFGQLADDREDLAAISDLAELGLKGNLLAEKVLVCWHVRYLARLVLFPVLRGFCASRPARMELVTS
jgi:hypothetical protein